MLLHAFANCARSGIKPNDQHSNRRADKNKNVFQVNTKETECGTRKTFFRKVGFHSSMCYSVFLSFCLAWSKHSVDIFMAEEVRVNGCAVPVVVAISTDLGHCSLHKGPLHSQPMCSSWNFNSIQFASAVVVVIGNVKCFVQKNAWQAWLNFQRVQRSAIKMMLVGQPHNYDVLLLVFAFYLHCMTLHMTQINFTLLIYRLCEQSLCALNTVGTPNKAEQNCMNKYIYFACVPPGFERQ